jgi:hypothetical protein
MAQRVAGLGKVETEQLLVGSDDRPRQPLASAG